MVWGGAEAAVTPDGNMQLPLKLAWELAQTRWASIINPLLSLLITQGQQIDTIKLTANVPATVYHSLGQTPSGWFIVDNLDNSAVWRNSWSATTIVLEASATTTISLWVY